MEEIEIWKPIDEFNESYEVSNMGRVKSLPKWMGRYFSEVRVLKPKIDKYGYERVTLCYDNGKRKYSTIHRLVANTFIKNEENLKTVNHIDGNKLNNRMENLEWMSNRDNIIHAWDTGLKDKQREHTSIIKGHKCYLTNIETGEKLEFNSKAKLSLFLGYNQKWLTSSIKDGVNFKIKCKNKGYLIELEGYQ